MEAGFTGRKRHVHEDAIGQGIGAGVEVDRLAPEVGGGVVVYHLLCPLARRYAAFGLKEFPPQSAAFGGVAGMRPSGGQVLRPHPFADCTKLRAVHGVELPDWQSSTAACVARLVATTDREQGQ